MMDLQRVNEYMSQVEESEKKVLPHGKRLKTGLDLGTAFIVLVVLDENDQPVACEKQAASVLRDGVVVDYSGACRIVRELKEKLEQRLGEELIDCAIAMPAGTESSVRTHQYVAESAGFEVTNILDEPTAANAIYQISDGVVVDIGGGTAEVAVISLSGIVASRSVRCAGDALDQSIIAFIKRKYNLLVGERTAEQIKIEIGSACPQDPETSMEIKGRNLVDGLPKDILIRSEEVRDAMSECLLRIVEAIKDTLECTPPELSSDIIDRGIMLSGGGALLRGLDTLIQNETGIDVHIAEAPLDCVALGAGAVLDNPELAGKRKEELSYL